MNVLDCRLRAVGRLRPGPAVCDRRAATWPGCGLAYLGLRCFGAFRVLLSEKRTGGRFLWSLRVEGMEGSEGFWIRGLFRVPGISKALNLKSLPVRSSAHRLPIFGPLGSALNYLGERLYMVFMTSRSSLQTLRSTLADKR